MGYFSRAMMVIVRVGLLVIVCMAMVVPTVAASGNAHVSFSLPPWPDTLSPYWPRRIQQWGDLIVEAAVARKLDPDFLASLVWMESRGDSNAVGPVGAVGLMQVMPREAGFAWRPSRDVLMDPGTNLAWGTRTLATVIGQGKGDVFNALAAYNGGWAQIMYRGPKIFATTILRDYAGAVAARYGLEGRWIAFFAVERGGGVQGPVWVADVARDDVYFYRDTNWTPDGRPLIPSIPPSAALAVSREPGTEAPFVLGVWLYDMAHSRWVSGRGEALPLEVARSDDTAPAESKSVAAPPVSPPLPTPTPTALPDPPCAGGSLALDAWPLERVNTPEGWKARIFAEGHGGNCRYTYAWNDSTDVRETDMRGPIVFEVTSSRRDAVIVGTVVVFSGDEVQRVGLYIQPPGR